jgi:hypothetical protein
MAQQLKAVGWDGNAADPSAVIDAYQRTTGGSVSPSGTSFSGGGAGGAATGGSGAAGGSGALGQQIQGLLGALASGNAAAAAEAARQFDKTFGLDQAKFTEAIRQYNQNFGLSEAALTGTYNGQPTLAAQQQQFQQALDAAGVTGMYNGQPTLAAKNLGLSALSLAVQQQANPFRQAEALYGMQQQGLTPLLRAAAGLAGPLPSFQAPALSAADTRSLSFLANGGFGTPSGESGAMPSYIQDQANSYLNNLPSPNKTNWTNLSFATPGAQDLVVKGLAQKYGLQEADIQSIAKATLPAFQAPSLSGSTRF